MKKFALLFTSLILVLGMSSSAMAVIPNGAGLTIDLGNAVSTTGPTTGSAFSMDTPYGLLWTNIISDDGIVLGATQPATGSHAGAPGCDPSLAGCNRPDGPETPGIDAPWNFFGNTGMHNTTSPVVDLGGGQVDMSGWDVTWNGISSIPMGGDTANFPTDTGIGALVVTGSSYTIDYSGHVPLGSPSGFGGVLYTLHLEGSIIPEPASMLLIGTGLVGILGLARRKK